MSVNEPILVKQPLRKPTAPPPPPPPTQAERDQISLVNDDLEAALVALRDHDEKAVVSQAWLATNKNVLTELALNFSPTDDALVREFSMACARRRATELWLEAAAGRRLVLIIKLQESLFAAKAIFDRYRLNLDCTTFAGNLDRVPSVLAALDNLLK